MKEWVTEAWRKEIEEMGKRRQKIRKGNEDEEGREKEIKEGKGKGKSSARVDE